MLLRFEAASISKTSIDRPSAISRQDAQDELGPDAVVARLSGDEFAVALAEADGLPLEGYHAFHATRADLLRRLGRSEESQAAYDRAIGLAGNTAEMKMVAYNTSKGALIASEDKKVLMKKLGRKTLKRPQQRRRLSPP